MKKLRRKLVAMMGGNGQNVILTAAQLSENDVCCVFIDSVTGNRVFIPVETLNLQTLHSRYAILPFVMFGMTGSKILYVSGIQDDAKFAEDNWYKVECDLTASGGFDWNVTINGTAKSGTVAWTAGQTLDDVVAQLATGAVNSRLMFEHHDGENFIRVIVNNYSNSTFTVSNATGTTLTDLSTFCKVGDVAQASAHRQWQGVLINTLFPSYPGNGAGAALYGQNGLNMSYRAGGNLERYKQYYRSSGSSSYVAEASGRMSEQGFASLNGDVTPGAQELYDKYGGSWDAYMEAGMVQIDSTEPSSMERKSYDDGVECSGFLASVTTMGFDGEYHPAFPAAAIAAATDFVGYPGCVPTLHELAVFMRDDRMDRINVGIDAIGGVRLANTKSNWSLAEYNANTAWLFLGSNGTMSYTNKYTKFGVRPVLASGI